ncbi:PREDICTED: transmembrane channel-like protein 5 isoform X2 [Polistes canadensis]|uniref:transmembrane channel-like protein 5 isoform X2 n=1 Tax=Polistes canadensis TaxID=91411 RepID=UPI0007190478|nr:PREDICTED: transmembrane channel-like protein 5 isoform X2 [Polistes canadensis]
MIHSAYVSQWIKLLSDTYLKTITNINIFKEDLLDKFIIKMAESHELNSIDSNVNNDDILMMSIMELDACLDEQENDEQDSVQQRSSGLSSLPNENDILTDLDSVIPYATCHIRRNTQISFQDHAETIATRLQCSNRLMQDDLTAEQLRMDILKSMPQCLTIRRLVKSKLHTTVQQRSKKISIGYWKRLKYKISFAFRKVHMIIQDIGQTMELWYHTIKSIEGSGFFENTIMYYGFYSNYTVEKIFTSTYSIPSAYFITLLCAYICTFIILSVKVVLSYRKRYIEIREKVQYLYCNKVFCGWDFAISSTKAANLQSTSICRELKELLAETKKHSQQNRFMKLYVIFVRIIISIITFCMICGTSAVLWVLLTKHEMDKSNASVMIVPVVITIIMNIFSIIISFLAKVERYNSKRVEVYVTVIRIHALAAVIISTLLAFWLIHSTDGCWQTELGKEIYRLIFIDFIISIFILYMIETVRSVIYVTVWKGVGRTKFDIAHSTLNLIYNQMLFWLGCYFSPLLSLIIIIKMILTFYAKKHSLLNYCEPPSRPWRAAQTHTLFLALSFIGIISILIMIGYIITNVRTYECGPFKGHNYTWEYVVDGVLELKRDSGFWVLISELSRPSIGAAILIAMSVGVYWLRAKAQANKEMLIILQDMLMLHARDKQFLFAKITNAGKIYRRTHLRYSRSYVTDETKDSTLSNEKD